MVASILTTTMSPTAQLYEHFVLDSRPEGYWRLGELAGTTAYDSSGFMRNGTYLGGPTLGIPGAIALDTDTSVRFDGVDDYVALGDVPLVEGLANVTVEAWVRIPTLTVGHHRIFSHEAVLYVGRYGGALSVYLADGATWTHSSVTMGSLAGMENTWLHVVYVKDGTTVRTYINGAHVGTLTGPATLGINSVNPVLGIISETSASQQWDGDMDEVAVYGRALTVPEIQYHYNVGSASRYGFQALDLDTVPHPILETVDAYQFDWATTPA